MTRSGELFERAKRIMPGGVSSPVRAFGAVGGTPVFMASGSGPRIVDEDSQTYIDMVGSWGPLIAGHAHPKVIEAIERAARNGTSFGAPTELEIELAGRIVDALPSVEMVRFVSSGTEASMSALRLARAATDRPRILKFEGCYHGHVDALLVAAGSGPVTLGLPDSPGVTEGTRGDTVIARYNSTRDIEEAFETFGSEIAGVIVEPIAANMGVVPPGEGFLERLRELCDSHGSLLIFDEVITGFRVGYSGAQVRLGVTPDITILGKIIGGGLPVGAYAGRRDLMELVAPSGAVYQAGTLSGNPLSMAAGIATLDLLRDEDPYPKLDQTGEILETGIADAAKSAGLELTVQRVGSMLTVFFTPDAVTDLRSARMSDTEIFSGWFHAMLDRRVYWPPSQFEAAFISTQHGQAEIEEVIEAAAYAFERIGP